MPHYTSQTGTEVGYNGNYVMDLLTLLHFLPPIFRCSNIGTRYIFLLVAASLSPLTSAFHKKEGKIINP